MSEHPAPALVIRSCHGPEEYAQLVRIWRSAVDATHDFLADAHRDQIERRLATDYFPQVHLQVAEYEGVLVGFAGVAGENLEMLFVDASQHGRGVGAALLEHVVTVDGVTSVDVNEQNGQAVAFYQRRGFVQVGRSALDAQGWPYPTLHLRRAAREPGPAVTGA